MIRTVPADAAAIVRAYPPMVVCFAAALTGTALVFDVFYLVASPGLALALVYTVPVLAGLIAGLVAAADDVGLERRVLFRTVVVAIATGITNAVVVAMLAAMTRTGPSDWGSGFQAILFAGCTIFAVAIMVNAWARLIDVLGIELRTKLPRRVPVAAAAVAVQPRPQPSSKESVARAEPPPTTPPPPPPAAEEKTVPLFVPPPPKVVDLDEARPVVSSAPASGGHADRLAPRSRRTTNRRPNKPGRRPGY